MASLAEAEQLLEVTPSRRQQQLQFTPSARIRGIAYRRGIPIETIREYDEYVNSGSSNGYEPSEGEQRAIEDMGEFRIYAARAQNYANYYEQRGDRDKAAAFRAKAAILEGAFEAYRRTDVDDIQLPDDHVFDVKRELEQFEQTVQGQAAFSYHLHERRQRRHGMRLLQGAAAGIGGLASPPPPPPTHIASPPLNGIGLTVIGRHHSLPLLSTPRLARRHPGNGGVGAPPAPPGAPAPVPRQMPGALAAPPLRLPPGQAPPLQGQAPPFPPLPQDREPHQGGKRKQTRKRKRTS
jgi:hypothetical protein